VILLSINLVSLINHQVLHLSIFFLAHLAKGRQGELLPSLGVSRLSSVNFSHFNLLRRFLKISQSETRIACGGHIS
jgi:hypothetical protein